MRRSARRRPGLRGVGWLLAACLVTIPAIASADASAPDAGAPDAEARDAGAPDAGAPDARAPDVGDAATKSGTDAREANGAGDEVVKEGRDEAVDTASGAPPVPIGTRFAEPLEAGQRVRLRYQFDRIKSQGLMIGDRDVNPGLVRNALYLDYDETPRALDVSVHTVELAWAPHPRTTLIVQVPFLQKDLETLEATGERRRHQTEGIGDVNFALVVPFIRKRHARAVEKSHVHVAFDVPSGSIRKEDRTGRRLPYDNQIGNGTVDFEWGWTYRGAFDRFAWGGQVFGRHPLGRNGLRYAEGSRFEASIWSGVRLLAGLSSSLRVQWQKQNNLDGPGDRAFLPITNPAENGKARGGTRFLVGPGLAWDLPGPLRGQRISLEASIPVYQDLDGPQLERDWVLATGWQWAY